MSSRIELFRNKLEHLINTMKNKIENDPYTQGVLTITKTIKKDFDKCFPSDIYAKTSEVLRKRAIKVCYKKNCPICNSFLITKHGKHGNFQGCNKYPTCKGSRNMKGDISINLETRDFIADKEYQEKIKKLENNMDRFDIWEIN